MDTFDELKTHTLEDQLKVKHSEIKSLTFSRKVNVDNICKMQRFYQQLQQEIKDLKMHKKLTFEESESENSYPCDKRKKSYRSAWL